MLERAIKLIDTLATKKTMYGAFFLGMLIASEQTLAQIMMAKQKGDSYAYTSYNDDKRGVERTLQYQPQGDDFVCVNGRNRFTRALYGGPENFRIETSDRPLFASYSPQQSRNISFTITLPGQKRTFLDSIGRCEARYTPGRRSYWLTASSWGKGELEISVLAFYDGEGAIWKITAVDMPVGTELWSGATNIKTKLNRAGDMGADPPDRFDAVPNPTYSSTCTWKLGAESKTVYMIMKDHELVVVDAKEGEHLYANAEKEREKLASRIRFETPDAFINTIGGVLATAADGIWDGQSWLHGAIGWRMPLTGWRAAYAGDFLGWHDRARTHFNGFNASQITKVPNTIPHPAQDTALNFARSVKRWGTPQYSNGYISRNPNRPDQMHHYDMNLVYIDELLWHLNWTGDMDYARTVWPVITRHLAWEKLNYDPDNDGLYDAYACIWASDALYYNSGAVTHSSAYNYRANKIAAEIAEKIGQDPTPYRNEAAKIRAALNARLWLKDDGHWAEYQDFMGLKRVHKSAGVYTIYHAIDSEIGDPFQAYESTRYIDTQIPHIPVRAKGLKDEGYQTISSSNWMPYVWSTNNVAFEEVWHTALAYFLAGRKEEGFLVLKSSILDGMYIGDSPGNLGQISFYDAARGECYRDFGDAIGIASRLFIQGLYGITPDVMNGRLLIRPGFPASWPQAALHTPDIDFRYKKQAGKDIYTITSRFSKPLNVELQIAARQDKISNVKVNGKAVEWKMTDAIVGAPYISIFIPSVEMPQGMANEITIIWSGKPITISPATGNRTKFEEVKQGQMSWWSAVHYRSKVPAPFPTIYANVQVDKCETVNIESFFNASVTDIFKNKYLSPRSPYTTLQIPIQGIGEWCHPLTTADINDEVFRSKVRDQIFTTSLGVPFRTPAAGKNIAFTSLWSNYPDSVTVPLSGKASHVYLLMAGSTNQMQSRISNGYVNVEYSDGSFERLELRNPETWAPIEQDYFIDSYAFKLDAPRQYRLHFASGIVSNDLGKALNIKGVYGREIAGGAGVLQDITLDPDKVLKQLTVRTLSNDVVIGLMSVTLQR